MILRVSYIWLIGAKHVDIEDMREQCGMASRTTTSHKAAMKPFMTLDMATGLFEVRLLSGI